MSRSGYSDNYEYLELWEASVRRAVRGRRGQAALRDAIAALDAMPVKALDAGTLASSESVCIVCMLGELARARGVDATRLDPNDTAMVGRALNIAPAMAAEVAYLNDERGPPDETPQQRWHRMRAWAASKLLDATGEQS